MKRRELLTLLGGAAAAWPLVARAQQAATMPRVGWIAIGTPQGSEFFNAFRQGLRQLGYVEGRSIIIYLRRLERSRARRAELEPGPDPKRARLATSPTKTPYATVCSRQN